MDASFIWDLDGTLLDSYPIIVSGLSDIYKGFGIDLDRAEILEHVITFSVTSFIQRMSDTAGIPFDEAMARYSEMSNQRKAEIHLVPHTKEVLEKLADKGADHYVFTHRGKSTEFILRNLDIYDLFEDIVTAQDGFARKPAPDAINYLLGKHGANPETAYYVGDRTIDVECAGNAGIQSILFLPAGSVAKATGRETYIARDLLEILDIV